MLFAAEMGEDCTKRLKCTIHNQVSMAEEKMTLEKVRKACLKDRDCIIMGNYRRISTRITLLLYRTQLLPWQITLIAFAIALAGAGLFLFGKWEFLVAGAVLLQVSFILDCVDGEIGRLKGTGSAFGAWIDPMIDYFSTAAFIGAAGVGQFLLLGDINILLITVPALINFGMLSLMIPTRARYVEKKEVMPTASVGKKWYIGNRSISVTVITLGALFNQLFLALALFATVWVLFWAKMAIDFYRLTKRLEAEKK